MAKNLINYFFFFSELTKDTKVFTLLFLCRNLDITNILELLNNRIFKTSRINRNFLFKNANKLKIDIFL